MKNLIHSLILLAIFLSASTTATAERKKDWQAALEVEKDRLETFARDCQVAAGFSDYALDILKAKLAQAKKIDDWYEGTIAQREVRKAYIRLANVLGTYHQTKLKFLNSHRKILEARANLIPKSKDPLFYEKLREFEDEGKALESHISSLSKSFELAPELSKNMSESRKIIAQQ